RNRRADRRQQPHRVASPRPFAYRPPVTDSTASPLAAAIALAPEIAAAADRIEADRRVPAVLVQALAAGGVFHMCVPGSLGGGEVDPATMVRVLETIAHADGSAGWSAMIGATSGVASAYLPHEAARE